MFATKAVEPVSDPHDPRALRRCLGRFTTGVTVVTYRVGEQIRGATVNSFTSVSMAPPLVLVSLARTSQACAAVRDVPFAVNVLGSDQLDVAMQFAGRPRAGTQLNWNVPSTDDAAPSLADAVAVFACRPWRSYDGGDHVLQLGEVTAFEHRDSEPLVFTDGRFMSPGLPILDGPLVLDLDNRPRVGWVGAARRLHALPEH